MVKERLLLKVGGGNNVNWEGICSDISYLSKEFQMILVHGASVQRDEIARKLSVPVKTVESPSGVTSVYTDRASLDIFLMVYAGLVNKHIVARLQKHGINAVGLSGVDGRLWSARRKKEILIKEGEKVKLLKDNLSGKVEHVNTALLQILLEPGYFPVICPPAISIEHEIVNTDNDLAIAVMAESLGIKKMVALFEAPGLLEDPEDEHSLILHIPRDRIDDYFRFAQGRMKKKIMGAKRAIECGVEDIRWGDARNEHPLMDALDGKGTVIS